MHPWIHCNMCMTITSAQLVVTSCGKVICSTCKPRLSTITCRQCQGPCTRTVALTDKAPKEVMNLFTDISEQLKAVFKNYNFQESQKRNLLEYKEMKSIQMKKMKMEMMEKKKADMDKLANLKEQIACLERREAELKNYFSRMTSPAPRENMRMLKNQEAIRGGINNEGRGLFGGAQVLGSPGFGTNQVQNTFGQQFGETLVGKRHSSNISDGRSGGGHIKSRERILGSSPAQTGFLEMKTPAVWYHKQKDRVDRNSPHQKLMELCAGRRSDGGSRSGGSQFFTSPPLLGGPRVTPNRMC